MLERTLNPRKRRLLWGALGFLCIVLIVFSGIVQVAHTHADGQVHSDCALCHVARAVVQPSVQQSLPHTVRLIATISAALQPIRPKRLFAFALYIRPPPVQAARA